MWWYYSSQNLSGSLQYCAYQQLQLYPTTSTSATNYSPYVIALSYHASITEKYLKPSLLTGNYNYSPNVMKNTWFRKWNYHISQIIDFLFWCLIQLNFISLWTICIGCISIENIVLRCFDGLLILFLKPFTDYNYFWGGRTNYILFNQRVSAQNKKQMIFWNYSMILLVTNYLNNGWYYRGHPIFYWLWWVGQRFRSRNILELFEFFI